MILQALCDYYKRKASLDDSEIAPPGFEDKEIPFIIVIDSEGKFVSIRDTREKCNKKVVGKKYRVPQAIKRSGKNPCPNFLWDTLEFIFGIAKEDGFKTTESSLRKKASFLKNIKEHFPDLRDNQEIVAVIKFLENDPLIHVENSRFWQEIIESNNPYLTFEVLGNSHLVCQNKNIVNLINESFFGDKTNQKMCLVTGEITSIARIHHPIKGIKGKCAQPSGTNIVSYNFASSESYKKEQGFNAPIGTYACFAYTTALNSLLRSKQMINIGDVTVVFWGDSKNSLEGILADVLDVVPQDDPDRRVQALKALYESPNSGVLTVHDDDSKFYVLGLSPNVSRLSINFWLSGAVKDFASNLKQHFDDLKIVGRKNEQEFFSLNQLMRCLAVNEDVEHLSPLIERGILNSAFQGIPYPQPLLATVLGRLRDKEGISTKRVALLKAWLNRYTRENLRYEKEVLVSLDETNNNIGYCLGRLFAVLEKTQEEAHGKALNTTIRDRFYGAASCKPITAFPNLMRLKNHHLAKLENRGRVVNLERLIGEIMEHVIDFPPLLSLIDQGRFAVGYYHQRNHFFNKSET